MLYNYIVKKILFLNTTFYSGGAAKIARTLFNNINKTAKPIRKTYYFKF